MKLTIGRIFDTAKALATEPGGELQDFINFCSQAFEQLIRGMRNQLSLRDNINAQVIDVVLKHNTEQVVNVSSTNIDAIFVGKTLPSIAGIEVVTGFGWQLTTSGQLVVKVQYASAVSDREITTRLVVFFT